MQHNYQSRVKEVINLYRSDPRSFNDEELDHLQELADQVGIKFSPVRDESSMGSIFKSAIGGFVEGLTTLPVGSKPKTTYDAIAHSLGHLVGFAPAILTGPLSLAAKGSVKLGAKLTGKKLTDEALRKGVEKSIFTKGAKGAQILDKVSVPMVASRFTKRQLDRGIKKAGLESRDFFKYGATGRGILEEAVGLGAASAVSSIWKGPDAMIDGFVGGSIAGGAFGGIGNFVSISNRLKMGNATQRKNAEKALRGIIGATVTGLPAHLRDEPIEMVLYETLLGGFFGYNARPSYEAEGGKFIQRSLYGAEKGRVFHPEGAKIWDVMHPKAQDYIVNQSTDMSKTWLGKNFDGKWVDDIVTKNVYEKAKNINDIKSKDIDAEYRNLAYKLYQDANPETKLPTAPPANIEETAEERIYREESTDPIQYADIIAMMRTIGNKIQKYSSDSKTNPKQIAQDIHTTYKNSNNAGEFVNSLKTSPVFGKSIDKPLEKRLRQFYHTRSKSAKEVFVATIEGGRDAKTEVKLGNWQGKKVGISMVDMPVHYTDPNGQHMLISHVKVKRDGQWQVLKPLETKLELIDGKLESTRGLSGEEYFQLEHALKNDNKYIHGGKKDNQELWTRDYHPDSKKPDGTDITPAEIIQTMVNNPKIKVDKAELLKSLQDSRKLEYKWFGQDPPVDKNGELIPASKLTGRDKTIQQMHDKAWVSNVLVMAERNGFHKTGEPIKNNLAELVNPDNNVFGKNVVDFNKREQLLYDRSVPQDPIVYSKELPEGNLRYMILNDIPNKEGKTDSSTDGSVIMKKSIFDKGIENMGLPDGSGMLKAVYLTKNDKGMMHVKNATRRANEVWENFLNENNIDVVFFSSAVKQTGNNKSANYKFDPKANKIVVSGGERNAMPIKDFRINPSTYESDKVGFSGIPRQVSSILNQDQTAGMSELFFKEIIEPSLRGVKDFDVKYKNDADIIKAIEADSQFVFKMPLELIHKVLKTDTPLSRKIRRQIIKMDEEGQLFEYGDSDFESFHQRNLRLLRLSDANFTTANFDKYGYKYWEPTYRRFIVSRYMQPKWESSSKAVLLPKTPDVARDLKINEIVLDNGQMKMPVKIEGLKSIKNLGQLWKLYNSKNIDPKLKAKLEEHMELVIVRVPADSVSGIRVVKLKGFTGEKGFGAITHPKADRYLGGADKDIESIFMFHGFHPKLKKSYKKHENEWAGKEAKSKENESLFVKGSKSELDIYKTIGSKFSPSMRKLVAESAVRGKDGLGFGLTARNTAMEWADYLSSKGGKLKLNWKEKTKKGVINASATIYLKNNGQAKLRELGREVVNYSADSADYPNMASPTAFRRILFDAAFEGHVTRNGKDSKLTYADIQRSPLGEISQLISVINPKGKDYTTGKAHTIHTLANFLRNYSGNYANNIHHHIAKRMQKDKLADEFISHHALINLGKKKNELDNDMARLLGIKEVVWAPIDKAEKSKKTEDPYEKQRDFSHKNIYTYTSLKALSNQAKLIEGEMKGKLKPNVIPQYLMSIRKAALRIKDQILINDGRNNNPDKQANYDKAVANAKNKLSIKLKSIKVDPKNSLEMFDMWLLSNINYINKDGKITSPHMQSIRKKQGREWKKKDIKGNIDPWGTSQQVYVEPISSSSTSNSAIRKMQKELNAYIKTNYLDKQVDLKVETKVEPKKVEVKKESPILTDKIDRMAITPEDMVQTTEFKKNLKENPQWNKNFRDLFTEFTMMKEGIPRDETTISMKDLYVLNNHFKELRKYPDSSTLQKSVWYNDLRTVDAKMKRHDNIIFPQYQTTVLTKDGPVKRTVKRSFSTLGTMKNWLHKVFLQQDAQLEAIDAINDNVFRFRRDIGIKDAEMVNDLVFKLRDLRRQKVDWNNIEKDPMFIRHKNKIFEVEGKKYTLKKLIEKVDADYTSEFQKFGNEWLWTTDKDGKLFKWKEFDSKGGEGEVNKYLKYNKDGKLDIINFLKKAVLPVEKGQGIPHIPLDTILRFHYEYKMEKFFQNPNTKIDANKLTRSKYRLGKLKGLNTAWKPVGEIKANEYFPKRYGHTKKSRNELNNHIQEMVNKKYIEVLEKTGNKKEAEKVSELLKAKMQLIIDQTIGDTAGIETSIIDQIVNRIDYSKLSAKEIARELGDIGANTRPESTIERTLDLPFGYDTSFRVIDRYKKQIIRSHYKLIGAAMANYRIDSMIKRQAFETDVNGNKVKYTKEQLSKLKEDGYRNNTDVWADYLRMYVRDAFGYQTTFPQRVIDAMGKNDSLKLKKNFYYLTSDQAIINGIESLNKKFLEKTGRNLPLLRNMPKGNTPQIKKARQEFYSRVLHKMGGLEARYQLMTLLAHTGVVSGNIYGGQTMNISSAGFRNVARAHSPKWIVDNILKSQIHKDNPLVLKELDPVTNKPIVVKDKKTLYKWVAEQGAIDNFIKNEFELNEGLKKVKGVTKKNLNSFRKEVSALIKRDPYAKESTFWEIARKYGVQDIMLKAGGSFMQLSERYLRTTSFLAHALQAREAFGKHGADIRIDDPYVIDMGLKGIENTQFLYHSAFRPAFMRTSLGKVFTRFKLFAFQSVRTRKEYYKMAKEMGIENDTEAMKKFKNLLTADLFTLALGSIYAYSLFDTALPPPWDWLKETGEWLFGSKREKERAFFGTYPYPLAPLQIITPPVARVPMSIFSSTLNGDWDRFADYNIHTMYPFGRLVRSLDKTIYDRDAGKDFIKESPHGTTGGRFMKQFFRLPVDPVIRDYKKSQIESQRREYMEELMERS